MHRFVFAAYLAADFGFSEAAVGHWIWTLAPAKRNGSECDTEACAGVTSLGGVVLSSADEVNACLLSVPSSCAFEITAAPSQLITGSILTAGGDQAILVDLQSLNAADEVDGVFGWGGGSVEVSLATPAEDACGMVIGYSSKACRIAAMEGMEAAQSAGLGSGARAFTFSPGEVYRSDFSCLQIYPSGSWEVCGGAVTEVKFHNPRLASTELKGRQETSLQLDQRSSASKNMPAVEEGATPETIRLAKERGFSDRQLQGLDERQAQRLVRLHDKMIEGQLSSADEGRPQAKGVWPWMDWDDLVNMAKNKTTTTTRRPGVRGTTFDENAVTEGEFHSPRLASTEFEGRQETSPQQTRRLGTRRAMSD